MLPVSVFAMEDKVKNVSVEIKTNEFFTSNGPTSKTIKFDEPGDQIVNFELDVASMLGIGKVQVIAKSGKYFLDLPEEMQKNENLCSYAVSISGALVLYFSFLIFFG